MDTKEADNNNIFLGDSDPDTAQLDMWNRNDITTTPQSSGTVDTITLSSPTMITTPTFEFSNVAYTTNTLMSNGINGTWSVGSASPYAQTQSSAKISLTGPNADIDVNGQSLMKTLASIEERLNILRPNTELEESWDQLKELGDQYRKLELELKEKQKMWEALKSMPKSNINL